MPGIRARAMPEDLAAEIYVANVRAPRGAIARFERGNLPPVDASTPTRAGSERIVRAARTSKAP
jgi:hypothetical protein